ncbi:MAG TPA: hypothetical protein VLD63_14280, partial [Anaerolineales bacterium]|nr:hypothetical protein [Anaerolineales bacterium]
MNASTTIILLLILLGVFVSSLDVLPLLVLALFPTSIRSSFDDSGTMQRAGSTDVALQRQSDALRQLGFSMLGVKTERMPLGGRVYRELDFVSPALQTYASIVLHPDSSPASFYCYTPLAGGGMVFTRNFRQAAEMESERLSVKNLDSLILSDVVEDHARRVRSMQQRGLVPEVGATRQARLDATGAFYESEYARSLRPSLRSPALRRYAIRLVIFAALAIVTI